ncbi:MurR/RpiR family transcriptional regulator [Piscibacillus sp. B03]|uniref:MurR/RpiR family transcriptional regulator n=1 Tax=Piscibacillus sp. B03 TaxID=3457430 RepID=UPI003FCC6C6E
MKVSLQNIPKEPLLMLEEIDTHSLSKKMQLVVDYYKRQPQVFATHSAEQLGRLIGVSESTIIRFAQLLDFKGFRDFQKAVQKEVFHTERSLSAFTEGKPNQQDSRSLVHELMQRDQTYIQNVLEKLSEDVIETFIETIHQSSQVYVAGVRTSASFAQWFTFGLNLVTGKGHLYDQQHSDLITLVTDLKPDTTLIVFSFHRYVSQTLHLAREAKRHGIKVLAVTDSDIAPITEFADVTIPIQLPIRSTLDAAPVTMSFLNAVLTALSIKQGEAFQERINAFESIQPEGFFIKD